MPHLKISKESWEVDRSLNSLGIAKNELVRVVHEAVAARNDATFLDPISAPGTLSYIYGTRELRKVLLLKKEGWSIDRTENIEGIYNKETNLKIIFQNTDCATNDLRSPKAISGKGPAAKRMIDDGQLSWDWRNENQNPKKNTSIWFLCVSVDEDKVTAEISCPRSIHNKQFYDFSERIYIIQDGEWDLVAINSDPDEDIESQEFEIKISKK